MIKQMKIGLLGLMLLGAVSCSTTPSVTQDPQVAPVQETGDVQQQAISDRNTIVSRAQNWVNQAIPYNQGAWYQGYRQDCSGFVSMAWDIGTSAVTSTLKNYAVTILRDQLQPGDAINNQGIGNAGHVVLFKGWLNAERTRFVALEENGGWGKAVQTNLTLVRKGAGWTIKEYEASAPGPYVFQRSKVTSSPACVNQDRGGGWVMTPGQSISVCNGKATLTLQWDGNLVLYAPGGVPLWNAGTAGKSAKNLVMQYDGNLVLYDTSNRAIWTTNTGGRPGAFFALQTDANMVIYHNGAAVWNSGTYLP
ncbi:hypothetical protein [Deinococcus cellulosilyticus]|uniref:Bulb-type lectin domain-containing protein n=1 Tax=Deinococcus cellulosilyticus (strain DSM 18568 / NBRC 106333 / KACC 11606 / 5516J-15) TaxID=1223518 RepID=A0A511N050_DEIC1|nr:hypothetical protein [Deinococcus cellulosilyticus]GEM46250.1 hypothetical protein DC3_18850 [Deinococcus cellulosilyticus NBRC 106333 = KACC 11606]